MEQPPNAPYAFLAQPAPLIPPSTRRDKLPTVRHKLRSSYPPLSSFATTGG